MTQSKEMKPLRNQIEKILSLYTRWVHGAITRCLNVLDARDELEALFNQALSQQKEEMIKEIREGIIKGYNKKIKAYQKDDLRITAKFMVSLREIAKEFLDDILSALKGKE